ncbi:protein kinase C theta type-like [Galendromus occidentalis]|uniref:Protein kinase C theta type-like n=1 Tax=Galendromus occidentalis TaxID=34638 RepID=A0AAJ6QXV6_9ACAR|nr:protein kinase C theta type-like [Galendromus occidentalis]
MWSVFQRMVDGKARTNNYAEGAHRRMQLEFGVSHPTRWKFIDGSRRIQRNRDFLLEQFLGGVPSAEKRTHRKSFNITKILLGELLKSHSQISLDYVPLETFAKQQSVRLISDILEKLNHLTLAVEDVKIHILNIAASSNLYRKQQSVAGAAMAMKCLRAFILAVAELCNLFELKSNHELTNWFLSASLCEQTLRALNIRVAYPAVDFIPRMEDFVATRTLGKGGFGAVFEARFVPKNIVVCIKLIPLSRLKKVSFASLDKILASVTEHAKLVQYYSSFLTTEAYVTVMECVQGIDLIRFIEARGELSADKSVVVLLQMVKAIAHLHAHGFIHRDVKLLNTLILPGGHIKIIDFDTCKICMAHFVETKPLHTYFEKTANEFSDQDYAGTITFLPPEIILRESYGRSIDWWAIGVTSFRLLAGRLPFRSKHRQKLKEMIVREEPEFPKETEESAKDFTLRLLHKNKSKRLGSRSYTELTGHNVFKNVRGDLPSDGVYFETNVGKSTTLRKERSKYGHCLRVHV